MSGPGRRSGTRKDEGGSPSESPRPRTGPALRTDEGERHASWLELFFDLVFVVSIAELARLLHDDVSLGGFLRFTFLFVLVWWAWLTFSYHSDLFGADDAPFRFAMLSAMLVVAALALNIHGAFGGRSFAFALCYVLLQAILIGLYARAGLHVAGEARGVSARFVAGFSAGALIWAASLLAPEPHRYWLWALALAVQVATPVAAYLTVPTLLAHNSHLPERLGLFTIIVLGESVVVIAAGVVDTDWRVSSVAAAALGFSVVGALWWLYFDRFDEGVTSRALKGGVGELLTRGFVYSYAHLPLFAGLAALAVGVELAVVHASEPALAAGERAALCGGVALCLVALTVVHPFSSRSPDRRVAAARLAAAAGAAGLALAGAYLIPLATVGLLVLVLAALTAFEHARPEATAGAPDRR